MSGSVNKVILIGNLGRDPDVRSMQDGNKIVNLSVATSESWKDKSGEWQEKTEWHNILCWGKLAEIAGKYLAKGRQCCVEGKLQTSSWDGDDGKKRYKTEVVASNVEFLGNKNDADNTGYTPPANTNHGPPAELPEEPQGKGSPIDDDGLPF